VSYAHVIASIIISTLPGINAASIKCIKMHSERRGLMALK